jgi:hypothetical protein
MPVAAPAPPVPIAEAGSERAAGEVLVLIGVHHAVDGDRLRLSRQPGYRITLID